MAGELELIARQGISPEEKEARIGIAKVMAYHKLYLTDDELRTGYTSVLNSVEQGREPWSSNLADSLEKFYEFRANVAWRTNNSTKSGGGATTHPAESKSPEEALDEGEGKIIYCMDYNRGTCSSDKSHVGKWKGRKVTKWHVCKICLANKELLSHPEKECKKKINPSK